MKKALQFTLASLLSAKSALAQAANFLFVGNSYTGSNGLAEVFDAIIEDGMPEWKDQVHSRSIKQGGRSLGRHMMDADGTNGNTPLRQVLVTDPTPWDWVTLQDQSQVPGFYDWDWEGTEYFRSTQAAIELDDMIADLGGQTMFFMTWGRRDGDKNNPQIFPDFLTMQDKLEEGYRRYQEATSTASRPTFIAPVGLVFKTIFMDELNTGTEPTSRDTLFRSLYTGDGSHPTPRGTYVAALTLYTSMTGKNPRAINWWPEQIPEETARALQYAVSRTILDTFNAGSIDYPWTIPFEAGTPPPRTSAPSTIAPLPPTPPPNTPAPGINRNKGSLTITFQYDEYPEEVSWTLMHVDTEVPLFFQPYLSDIEPHSTTERTFNNLEPGQEYMFRVSDSEGDGICCGNGKGRFNIYDNVQARGLYNIKADFRSYFEIKFKIMPNGQASPNHRSQHYRPGTWDDLETIIAPKNNAWPGKVPTQSKYSLMVNMEVDNNPEELSWSLFRRDRQWNWATIRTWDGSAAKAGAMESTELNNLDMGWYRFVVRDAAANGACCDFGRGFVSIMGALYSQNGKQGLVWGNNGQFKDEEEIFFRMDPCGEITHIRWADVKP